VRNRDRVGSRWANMTQSDAIVWVLFGVFLFLVSLFGSNLGRWVMDPARGRKYLCGLDDCSWDWWEQGFLRRP